MPRRSSMRHAGPVVGAAVVGPRVLRPGLVAELAGLRNGVEDPAQRPGADVVGADVSRRAGQAFVDASADDHQVAIDRSGRGQADRLRLRIPAEVLAEIDPSLGAERRDRRAGLGVEGIDVFVDRRENPRRVVGIARPVHQAAIRAAALQLRVEGPDRRAGGRVQGEHFLQRGVAVEDAVDHHRLGLQVPGLAGVVGPRDLQPRDGGPVDLRERGIAALLRPAAVGPARSRTRRFRRTLAGRDRGQGKEQGQRGDRLSSSWWHRRRS